MQYHGSILNSTSKGTNELIKEGAKIVTNIHDILDYIIVCLYSKYKEDERFINCIKYINECSERLRANSNFDMSVDNMLIKIWEELNESSNRC